MMPLPSCHSRGCCTYFLAPLRIDHRLLVDINVFQAQKMWCYKEAIAWPLTYTCKFFAVSAISQIAASVLNCGRYTFLTKTKTGHNVEI